MQRIAIAEHNFLTGKEIGRCATPSWRTEGWHDDADTDPVRKNTADAIARHELYKLFFDAGISAVNPTSCLLGDPGDLLVKGYNGEEKIINVKTSFWPTNSEVDDDYLTRKCNIHIKHEELGDDRKPADIYLQVFVHMDGVYENDRHVHLAGRIGRLSPTFEKHCRTIRPVPEAKDYPMAKIPLSECESFETLIPTLQRWVSLTKHIA